MRIAIDARLRARGRKNKATPHHGPTRRGRPARGARRAGRAIARAGACLPRTADPVTTDRMDAPAALDVPQITLTLPDGATRSVPAGTLPRDVVASIGERLLRAEVAVSVDGEVQDLVTPLRRGGAFRVITERDAEALAVLRHSGAHILATAVRRLRTDAKIGFGPAIEDGFYYDFEVA